MGSTVVLYRPVGPKELELIRESDFRRFPPRLPEQSIFYPVVQLEYARKIARDWNVKSSGAGYVTRFFVNAEFLGRYTEQQVGGDRHREYWIPSHELDEFNDNIVGRIEVLEEYLSDEWKVAYDLAQDKETVDLVQQASTGTGGFGVAFDVALFGSEEWWRAVRDGRIPKYEISGTISRLFTTGHGDWPEFELTSQGTTTKWTRVGNHEFYVEGREAIVEYVVQKLRRHQSSQDDFKQVIRVLVKVV